MKDSVTIVLDPGHGGENHGLEYNGFVEKEMNLVVANAMKAELEKYEGVTVYLTNPQCQDMTLQERAQYAKSVEADVLISLHFNMSENHKMFGSEVWIPSQGANYAWMHTLGDLFLETYQENGLHNRGVKTRLNGRGTDYYGILRESTSLEIPSILVEHCYADAIEDAAYLEGMADLESFGVWDATAVAKYYGLTSTELGVDYSSYVKNAYFIPEGVVGADQTPPQQVKLVYVMTEETVDINQSREMTFLLEAKETESTLCYYEYSVDGGENWSELLAWEAEQEVIRFTVEEMPHKAQVVARVYNGHFLDSLSNTICFITEQEQTTTKTETETETDTEAQMQMETETQMQTNNQQSRALIRVGSIVAAALALLFLVLTIFAGIKRRKKECRVGGVATGSCIMLTMLLLLARSDLSVENLGKESAQEREMEVDITTEVNSAAVLNCEDTQYCITASEALLLQEQQNDRQKDKELIYDIARGYLLVDSLPDMPRNTYDFSRIEERNGYKYYRDEKGNITSMLGVDVSKFQGTIQWDKVRESGMEFAILRLGLRGYGSGKLVTDDMFYVNYDGATAAGLKTGVYFFSGAISVEEAIEEANYVSEVLGERALSMPVVFDTEPILYDKARTDDLTPQELTDITRAFCDRIKELGYTPMIYANAKRYTTALYTEQLKDIAMWYADYQEKPLYPYAYQMWQYTEKGSVEGISGPVDIDLFFEM